MPRLHRLFLAGAAASLVAWPLAGCGGGDSKAPTDTRKPPRSAEIPPPRLPSPDKHAYAAIQRSSGDLRAAVTPAAYGAGRIATDQLQADIRRLDRTQPRSRVLSGLRLRTVAALRSVTSGAGGSSKAIASAAIGEADRIDDGLRRYAASHPAANEIAPG